MELFSNLNEVPQLTSQPPTGNVTKRSDLIRGAAGKLMRLVQVELPGGGGFKAIVEPRSNEPVDERVKEPGLDISGFPKIPWNNPTGSMLLAWIYFREVWKKQSSEAFLYWHWDKDDQCYHCVVPSFYTASAGALNYKPASQFCKVCSVALHDDEEECPHCGENGNVQPLCIVGTSHSHGSMSHFHSGTDHDNELNATGFHLTFGHINQAPMIEFSFVVSDGHQRFGTEWYDHCSSPLDHEGMRDKMKLWLSLVTTHSSLYNGNNWVVVDAKKRPIFIGSKSDCEEHVAGLGQVHKDKLTIGQPKRQATAIVSSPYKSPGGYSSKGASIGSIGRKTIPYRSAPSSGHTKSKSKVVGAVEPNRVSDLNELTLDQFTEAFINGLPHTPGAACMLMDIAQTVYDGFGFLDDYVDEIGPETFGVMPAIMRSRFDDTSAQGPSVWIKGKKYNFSELCTDLYDRIMEANRNTFDGWEDYIEETATNLANKADKYDLICEFEGENEEDSAWTQMVTRYGNHLNDLIMAEIICETASAGPSEEEIDEMAEDDDFERTVREELKYERRKYGLDDTQPIPVMGDDDPWFDSTHEEED